MRTRLVFWAFSAALVAVAAAAPSAGAVHFGADLNAASNNTGTCNSAYSQPTCTHYSGVPGPSFYSPGTGVITQVRVKTANVPQGPMQIVLLRSLFQNNPNVGVDPNAKHYFACCFVQQYGPVFTPAPGAITTVPTSLPAVSDPTPPFNDFTTNARGDFLALSVLAPNVPVPANLDGNPGDPFSGSGFGAYAPAPNPSTTPAPSPNPLTGPSSFGAHLMMDAELSEGASGGGGGGGVPQGNLLKFPSGGSLVGSTASIPIECVLTTACEGTLRLTNQALTAKAKKVKVYGTKKFKIPAGKKRNVKVKLNKAGKRKLGRKKSLKVTATATIGAQTQSSSIKLKKKKKKR